MIPPVGSRVGYLTYVRRIEVPKPNSRVSIIFHECLCDCGTSVKLKGREFRKGRRSCGCKTQKHYPDIEIGKIYGSVRVISEIEPQRIRRGDSDRIRLRKRFLCECTVCGTTSTPTAGGIRKEKRCIYCVRLSSISNIARKVGVGAAPIRKKIKEGIPLDIAVDLTVMYSTINKGYSLILNKKESSNGN